MKLERSKKWWMTHIANEPDVLIAAGRSLREGRTMSLKDTLEARKIALEQDRRIARSREKDHTELAATAKRQADDCEAETKEIDAVLAGLKDDGDPRLTAAEKATAQG